MNKVLYDEIFTSRLMYYKNQRRVKIKPESEISCHITLTSVISGLNMRNIFTARDNSWGW